MIVEEQFVIVEEEWSRTISFVLRVPQSHIPVHCTLVVRSGTCSSIDYDYYSGWLQLIGDQFISKGDQPKEPKTRFRMTKGREYGSS